MSQSQPIMDVDEMFTNKKVQMQPSASVMICSLLSDH